MFPTQQCQSPNLSIFEDLSSFQSDTLLEELLVMQDAPTSNVINTSAKKRGRKRSLGEGNEGEKSITKDMKKILHKEVERQRRQEMAALFASLRSLLPLHYIKGKRATSDHMSEAVKYITEMQKKIEGMRNQRDKLKSACRAEEVANISDSTSSVKVNLVEDEIEILISSGLTCEAFSLSRVLTELIGRGLNVVTCVSTRVHERSLHRIQIQASDPRPVDLLELECSLTSLIRFA